MFKKSLSLGRFYWDCVKAYFRPSTQWTSQTMGDFLSRLFYYFCNWWYNFFLNIAEYLAFYWDKKLRCVNDALNRYYAFPNQFWVSLKEGLEIEPQKLYRLTYGETSWFALDRILKDLDAGSDDVFYDLGCGVGKNVFFAHIRYGMRSTGIDLIPTFSRLGQQVAAECQLENIRFIQGNAFQQDFRDATIIFVTANCFDRECMEQLAACLAQIKPGTQVVSTAKPIQAEHLNVTGSRILFFSWGIDRVYFHERV